MAVGESLWEFGVCWVRFGGALASNKGGTHNLMETVGSPTSVADIWSGITSVETDCRSGEDSCGGRKVLFARDRRLLEIFGQGPSRFGIFGSVSTSVEDVDDPIGLLGEYMPCG